MSKTSTKQDGFILLTVLVILIVAGILGGAVLARLQVDEAYKRETITEARLAKISEAISIYIARNGRMVCPAPITAAEDTVNFGAERIDGAGASLDCILGSAPGAGVLAANDNAGVNTIRTGLIPVRSLNISDEHMLDGWNKPFTLTVSANLTNAAPDPANPGKTFYQSRNGTITILNQTNGVLQNNLMYYLFSSGGDNKGAYRFGSTTPNIACGGAGLDLENCDADGVFRTFVDGTTTQYSTYTKGFSKSGGATQFDDLFRTSAKITSFPSAINKYVFDRMPCNNANGWKSVFPSASNYTFGPTTPNPRGENCASTAFGTSVFGRLVAGVPVADSVVNNVDGIPDVLVPNRSCNVTWPFTNLRRIPLYSRVETAGSTGQVTIRMSIPGLYNNDIIRATTRLGPTTNPCYNNVSCAPVTDNDNHSSPGFSTIPLPSGSLVNWYGGANNYWENAVQVSVYFDSDTTDATPSQLLTIGDLFNPQAGIFRDSGSSAAVLAVGNIIKDRPYRLEVFVFCFANAGWQEPDQISAWVGTIRLEDHAADGYVELIEDGFQ